MPRDEAAGGGGRGAPGGGPAARNKIKATIKEIKRDAGGEAGRGAAPYEVRQRWIQWSPFHRRARMIRAART